MTFQGVVGETGGLPRVVVRLGFRESRFSLLRRD